MSASDAATRLTDGSVRSALRLFFFCIKLYASSATGLGCISLKIDPTIMRGVSSRCAVAFVTSDRFRRVIEGLRRTVKEKLTYIGGCRKGR
jgi:hypothetical protein